MVWFLFIIEARYPGYALAQAPLIEWSQPLNLSNSLGDSTVPTIAADSWGHIHVFWIEKIRSTPRNSGQPPQRGDTIFYRQFDGQKWLDAIDVLAAPAGAVFDYPSTATDQSGWVYLVWSSQKGLLFSSAYFSEAPVSAQNWQRPRLLAAEGPVERPQIIADSEGVLHVVYAAANSDGNIHYLRSTDGGQTWTPPVTLSQTPVDPTSLHLSPKPVLDNAGRIHVAWFEVRPPGWVGDRVWYIHSEDTEGISWSEPQLLAEQAYEGEFQGTVSLAVAGPDQLVALWVCGEVTHRCTRSSNDGGVTWGPIQRIFGGRASLAGWDTIGTDATGNAYLIVQLRSSEIPNAVYYSGFSAGRWIDPPIPIVTEGPLVTGHHPHMAVSQGNKLHVVIGSFGESEIYYLTATTSAPHQAATGPIPTQLAPPTIVAQSTTPTPLPTDRPRPTIPAFTTDSTTTTTSVDSPGFPLLAGVLPVLLIVVSVIGMHIIRGKT